MVALPSGIMINEDLIRNYSARDGKTLIEFKIKIKRQILHVIADISIDDFKTLLKKEGYNL